MTDRRGQTGFAEDPYHAMSSSYRVVDAFSPVRKQSHHNTTASFAADEHDRVSRHASYSFHDGVSRKLDFYSDPAEAIGYERVTNYR